MQAKYIQKVNYFGEFTRNSRIGYMFKASSAKELQNVRSLISITYVYNKHINSASEEKEKFKVGIIVSVG